MSFALFGVNQHKFSLKLIYLFCRGNYWYDWQVNFCFWSGDLFNLVSWLYLICLVRSRRQLRVITYPFSSALAANKPFQFYPKLFSFHFWISHRSMLYQLLKDCVELHSYNYILSYSDRHFLIGCCTHKVSASLTSSLLWVLVSVRKSLRLSDFIL